MNKTLTMSLCLVAALSFTNASFAASARAINPSTVSALKSLGVNVRTGMDQAAVLKALKMKAGKITPAQMATLDSNTQALIKAVQSNSTTKINSAFVNVSTAEVVETSETSATQSGLGLGKKAATCDYGLSADAVVKTAGATTTVTGSELSRAMLDTGAFPGSCNNGQGVAAMEPAQAAVFAQAVVNASALMKNQKVCDGACDTALEKGSVAQAALGAAKAGLNAETATAETLKEVGAGQAAAVKGLQSGKCNIHVVSGAQVAM